MKKRSMDNLTAVIAVFNPQEEGDEKEGENILLQ